MKATTGTTTAQEYQQTLQDDQWQEITARDTAKDIKGLVIFQLHKQMTDEQMYHKIIHRHI